MARKVEVLPPDEAEKILARARNVGPRDVEKAAAQDESVLEKRARGPLRQRLAEMLLLRDLVRDYWRGEYRAVPWRAIAGGAFALLYIVNPLDIFPDVVPLVGYIDDAFVLTSVLELVGLDVLRYEKWRNVKCKT